MFPTSFHHFKKPGKSLLIAFLLLLVSGASLKATHIVGGDFEYRCLGGNRYEISLTLRRDCLNGNPGAQFDNPAAVGIFNSNGLLQTQLANGGRMLMEYRRDDTLNEILVKTCGIEGGDVCVHTTTYRDTVELPFLEGGYILAYQRCCRNYTILNIINPLETGATYTLEIKEEALRSCNSSPRLGAYPPIYLCGGLPFEFKLKAKDEEGDSLVYKLCTPYTGADQINPRPAVPSNPPYDPVQFKPPYSLNDMIGGIPALQMNSATGTMSGYAVPLLAQYLIAYCIEEYRDGKLMSVMRRDFQINVRLCNSAPVASFDYTLAQCKLPVQLALRDSSSDPFSTLVAWNWTLNLNGNIQQSTLRHPVFRLNQTGTAEIQLIVESEKSCRDTTVRKVQIALPKTEFYFQSDTICLNDSIDLIRSYDPDYKYIWSPVNGLSCADCPNPKAGPQKNTRYILRSYDGHCERFDTVDVFVKPCFIDPCVFLLDKNCLANGMVEVTALDANGRAIIPGSRKHELFWEIQETAQHPKYILLNQNPIQVFKNDVLSLTSKFYSWPAGLPKTIEYADICVHRTRDSLDLDCSGPCAHLKFILSSCHDDYHKENQLNYPDAICESICGGACQYIIALFEENGNLIDPSDYQIRWSTGGTGAYVMMMGRYFNTLSVEVRKGDCIWRGRYWKSCELFDAGQELQANPDCVERGASLSFSQLREKLNEGPTRNVLYNLSGQSFSQDDFESLPNGFYILLRMENGKPQMYKIVKSE